MQYGFEHQHQVFLGCGLVAGEPQGHGPVEVAGHDSAAGSAVVRYAVGGGIGPGEGCYLAGGAGAHGGLYLRQMVAEGFCGFAGFGAGGAVFYRLYAGLGAIF